MRWGGTKSQKYPVPAVAVEDPEALAKWADFRFRIWLCHRKIGYRLAEPPRLKRLGSQYYLEYNFVKDGSSRTSVSSSDLSDVFHGSYFSSVWNILRGATLAESTPGQNGSETRDWTPGVYATLPRRNSTQRGTRGRVTYFTTICFTV